MRFRCFLLCRFRRVREGKLPAVHLKSERADRTQGDGFLFRNPAQSAQRQFPRFLRRNVRRSGSLFSTRAPLKAELIEVAEKVTVFDRQLGASPSNRLNRCAGQLDRRVGFLDIPVFRLFAAPSVDEAPRPATGCEQRRIFFFGLLLFINSVQSEVLLHIPHIFSGGFDKENRVDPAPDGTAHQLLFGIHLIPVFNETGAPQIAQSGIVAQLAVIVAIEVRIFAEEDRARFVFHQIKNVLPRIMRRRDFAKPVVVCLRFIERHIENRRAGRIQLFHRVIGVFKIFVPVAFVGQRPDYDARVAAVALDHLERGAHNQLAEFVGQRNALILFTPVPAPERRLHFDHQADLIADIEEPSVGRIMRGADKVDVRGAEQFSIFALHSFRNTAPKRRMRFVPVRAARFNRYAIHQKLVSAHFNFAHAKTTLNLHYRFFIHRQRAVRHVKVRVFRIPFFRRFNRNFNVFGPRLTRCQRTKFLHRFSHRIRLSPFGELKRNRERPARRRAFVG